MFKKIYLLLLLPLFMAGCVQTETQLTINKDNSAVFEQKFFVDSSLFVGDEPKLKVDPERDEKKKILEAQTGLTFKEFHDDGKVGTIGTKKIYDLRTDEWNSTLNTNFFKIKTNSGQGRIVDIKTGFFKTDYNIDIEIKPIIDKKTEKQSIAHGADIEQVSSSPLPDENEASNMQDKDKIDEAILSAMKSTYLIKIPVRAYSNNSQNIDTKNLIYKWDLKYDSFTPIKLRYCVYNFVNIITMIVIILIIIGELFYFTMYKKD